MADSIGRTVRSESLLPAAAYIRMSGHKQERSPAQQKSEIVKLAAREGCRIDHWFQDDAITGDSGPLERPDFRRMLEAAQEGKYQRLLAYDQDRIGRFDSIDAGQWMAPLRTAGVQVITCVQGKIDWTTFEGRIIYTVNQEAKKRFLEELSGKVVRGKVANAKAGGWNGGPPIFGMDRGLFGPSGNLVRRLLPGEVARMDGHRIHLLPTTDTARIEAVRFAFTRLDQADLSIRDVARELEAKGYPSPTGKGWSHHNVAKLLRNRAYVGTCQWGVSAWGKYHTAQGEDIVALNGNGKRGRRQKPQEDAIAVENAHEGLIEPKLFNRVQRKMKQRERPFCRRSHRANYPLAGLIFCEHCGKPMYGSSLHAKDRQGSQRYAYHQYVCGTYANRNGPSNGSCGRNPIDANRVLGWIVHKLQEVFLGPGRGVLVEEIKRQLAAEATTNTGDVKRLEKRAADLDREVGRLVKAIRTIDAAELVEELTLVRTERDRVKAELAQASRFTDPTDLDTEAEQIADGLWEIGEQLTASDPAVLREVLSRFVSRITCRFDYRTCKSRSRSRFVEGTLELREQSLFSVFGVMAQASRRTRVIQLSCGRRATTACFQLRGGGRLSSTL